MLHSAAMTRREIGCVAIASLVCGLWPMTAGAQAPDGAALFARACSSCHNAASESRAPSLTALQPRTPEAIIEALVTGAMRAQGSRLSGADRRTLAEFITGKKLSGEVSGASTGRCTSASSWAAGSRDPQWTGWSVNPTNTRFQPADQARLTH